MKNQKTLTFVPDHLKTKKNVSACSLLRSTPDQCKAQQICDKFLPKCFKTQGMCNKVVNRCFFVFDSNSDRYKTQEMCDKVISEDASLMYTVLTNI